MAFRDFSFPEVQQALGLTLAEADLFGSVSPIDLPAEFAERMRAGVDLALAINTEKARSEFIIAPVLMELRRQLGDGPADHLNRRAAGPRPPARASSMRQWRS